MGAPDREEHPLKIIVDAYIPYGQEFFQNLGEVSLVPGRAITPEVVRHADAVITRTITPIHSTLLQNSAVQFVGSATAGVDHVDQEYLRSQGIGFSGAAGCNANSVAEYVLTALLVDTHRKGKPAKDASLGIVGVGHIGKLVAQKAQTLGMTVLLNDPPLAKSTGNPQLVPLDDLLAVDYLTLHVPLAFEGDDPTFHLFQKDRLSQLSPTTVLINTARGEVVDNQALEEAVRRQTLPPPILDVWEGEPHIAWSLLDRVSVGTSHIAGYSLDAKFQGARMVYEAACSFFNTPVHSVPLPELTMTAASPITIDANRKTADQVLFEIMTQAYFLLEDHARLQALLSLPLDQRPGAFEQLRHFYPQRREFDQQTVILHHATEQLHTMISSLGFTVH